MEYISKIQDKHRQTDILTGWLLGLFQVGGCDTVGVLFPVDLSVVAGVDSDGGGGDAGTLTMLGIPILLCG